MASNYKSGDKKQVIRLMAEYAIRDQYELIDSLTPCYGEPDETSSKAISNARDCIDDFKRIVKVMCK